jgi:ABC-type sugar transport system ATPase subunit
MNFFDAIFEIDCLKFGEQKLQLNSNLIEKIRNETKRDVILGVRPEHIKISPERFENSYQVKITVVEFLGAETIITFEFADGISGMVSAPGFYNAKMGDFAYVSFPLEKIHIFDKDSQNNLVDFN